MGAAIFRSTKKQHSSTSSVTVSQPRWFPRLSVRRHPCTFHDPHQSPETNAPLPDLGGIRLHNVPFTTCTSGHLWNPLPRAARVEKCRIARRERKMKIERSGHEGQEGSREDSQFALGPLLQPLDHNETPNPPTFVAKQPHVAAAANALPLCCQALMPPRPLRHLRAPSLRAPPSPPSATPRQLYVSLSVAVLGQPVRGAPNHSAWHLLLKRGMHL